MTPRPTPSAIFNKSFRPTPRGVVSLLVLALVLSGCVMLQGDLQKGRYVAHSGEFSINLPHYDRGEYGYRNIKAGDGAVGNREGVVFANHGHWLFGGIFSVEWHRLNPGMGTASAYIADLEKNFHTYTRENYVGPDKMPVELTVMLASDERLRDRPARRWIARGQYDGRRAVMAVTAADYGDRVALVSVLYAIDGWARNKEERWENPNEAIPWHSYLPFVESFQQLK